MRLFLSKTVLFAIPILLLPLLFYIIIDPFKVIFDYPEQINTDKPYQITWNRDYQSTQLFLNNYKKYNYDSFILGNSMSFFYQVTTWEKYIDGNCIHFNASNESLYGMWRKINLLDSLKVNIKNALIVINSNSLIGTQNSLGHLFIKHPTLSNESWFTFHATMFKGFFPKPIFAFIDLFFTGKLKPYMYAYGIRNKVWKHDMVTNQISYYIYDQQIKENPEQFYADKMKLFVKRDTVQTYNKAVINGKRKILLNNIKNVLKSHKTNYKIIISPLYDQIKFNRIELEYLKNLFGAENIFDFSGINNFTEDYHSFYEGAHYRPVVCDSILGIIYM